MAAYTKADFDELYRFRVCRYFGGRPLGSPPTYIHYHHFGMAPILAKRWALWAPILQIPSSSRVMVLGAGFGWGVEALIAETGVTCVGVDLSDYIATAKDTSEEEEIRAEIIAAGLDPDSGRGQTILNGVVRPGNRTKVVVLQEDVQLNTGRQAIRSALGGWPDVCIVEDLIDDNTTEQEISFVQNGLDNFAGSQRIIWITDGSPTISLQQLHTLTGAEVISTNGQTYFGGPV